MTDRGPWLELERCRRQAEALGNHALARDRASALLDGADAEVRYHVERFVRWCAGRLAAQQESAGDFPGRVEVPLLDRDGTGEVFLASLRVRPAASGGMSREFFASLERAAGCAMRLVLAQGALAASAPDAPVGIRLEGPPALGDMEPGGGSAAAGAALALVSSWTGTQVPAGTVVTGALSADGALLPVDHAEAKAACALRERPQGMVALPPGAGGPEHPRVIRPATLAELVAAVLGPLPASAGPVDIMGSVHRGEWLYKKAGRTAAARALLEHCLGAIRQGRADGADPRRFRREELICLWRIGSCLTHQGDEAGALSYLREAGELAELLWAEQEVAPEQYFGVAGSAAVLLRDTLKYGQAEAVLLRTLQRQRDLHQDRRQQARTMGNLGELWTFMGKFHEAEQILGEALESLQASYPDEAPRELCYLGNCALAAGDPALALQRHDRGLRENLDVEYGREANEVFLRYGRARALLALGQLSEAAAEADRVLESTSADQPFPRQLCLKVRGLCRLAGGEQEAGAADLRQAADPTHAPGALLRFGLATALAHLALHHLDAGDQEQGHLAARQFITQAAPYLDAHHDPTWSKQALAAKDPGPPLRQAIKLFPY